MRATAIAHQNSRLQTENERLKKFIGLRGEKVDKDMSKIKDLSHELRMAQDDASQRKQEANALARRVAAVEAELDKKVKELAEMVEVRRPSLGNKLARACGTADTTLGAGPGR